MAFKTLSATTMIEVSGAWIDPASDDHAILSAHASTKALLPKIAIAHARVVATHGAPTTGAGAARLAEIVVAESDADALHDRKLRGTFHALSALADLTDDPKDAARYLDLRDRLVPTGLTATQRSYADEAGDAKLVQGRLDAASKALLKSLDLPTGKLADDVKAWTSAAKTLGELETEKAKLEAAATGGTTTAGKQLEARNGWVRIVNLLVATIDAEDAIDAATATSLLAVLRKKEGEAARREAKAAKGASATTGTSATTAGGATGA